MHFWRISLYNNRVGKIATLSECIFHGQISAEFCILNIIEIGYFLTELVKKYVDVFGTQRMR